MCMWETTPFNIANISNVIAYAVCILAPRLNHVTTDIHYLKFRNR